MPRRTVEELTAKQVEKIAKTARPGYHLVGGVSGLSLQVKASRSTSWILRQTYGGKRREFGLGSFPSVTLAMARQRAREALDDMREGIDPSAKRRAAIEVERQTEPAAPGMSFREAWLEYRKDPVVETKKGLATLSTLEARLTLYAFPVLGEKGVNEITKEDVLEVLRPIWAEKTETASRTRIGIEAVLTWATGYGHRTGENPARWKGHLDVFLPAPKKVTKEVHRPALPVVDLPAFMRMLRMRNDASVPVMEFLILTAARPGEALGALWSEIDLRRGEWIIPAERMKMDREHRIPLSRRAVELLKATPRVAGTDVVFPGQGLVKPMSDGTLPKLIRSMDEAEVKSGRAGWKDRQTGKIAVPHGFRSTFRDWATEQGYDHDMAEIALAHKPGTKVERTYRRTDMFERRRDLMQAWTDYAHGAKR